MAAVDCMPPTDAPAPPPCPPPAEEVITPDYVNAMTEPAEGFLCPLSANRYGINFTSFKIRSVEDGSEQVLFEVGKGEEGAVAPPTNDSDRFIQYHFGPAFLDFKTVGTTLEFSVGDQPLHNFRMIERHYFGNQLIRSYDFDLPFVIPGTTNTWEVIYTMPELNQEWKDAVIANPWATRSDSFYFVDGELVMHNKAEYNYGL